MPKVLRDWFTGMGEFSKALRSIGIIIAVTIAATLMLASYKDVPERLNSVEAAVDTLKVHAAENRAGIQEVRKNTETILCIMSLPASIPPAESRLRCP